MQRVRMHEIARDCTPTIDWCPAAIRGRLLLDPTIPIHPSIRRSESGEMGWRRRGALDCGGEFVAEMQEHGERSIERNWDATQLRSCKLARSQEGGAGNCRGAAPKAAGATPPERKVRKAQHTQSGMEAIESRRQVRATVLRTECILGHPSTQKAVSVVKTAVPCVCTVSGWKQEEPAT